jgi:RNA polymerase sigma-70 factor (ECF subfamily)
VLTRCLAGDWNSYGWLVERYRRMVWAVVDAVLVEKSEVADVVQEVFIRAYQKLPGFRFQSAFSTWLYRLARNHAISHLRSRRRRPQTHSIDAEPAVGTVAHERLPGPSFPDADYLEAARQRELTSFLKHLDSPYREVINLYYLGDYSYEEMAELLSVPVNTVKTRLRRARMRLVSLAEQGGWR